MSASVDMVAFSPEFPGIFGKIFFFSPAFKQGMEFSSDSEAGPKMGPGGEQTEEEKEAIEAYMAYIENERGMHRTTKQYFSIFCQKMYFRHQKCRSIFFDFFFYFFQMVNFKDCANCELGL